MKREPIYMTTMALTEMCAPAHANNVFVNYAFNNVSQAKSLQHLESNSLQSKSQQQSKQKETWLNDDQILQKQLIYEDFCLDETLDPNVKQCPTNKQMLHYAITSDIKNREAITDLQNRYKNSEHVKEQVF